MPVKFELTDIVALKYEGKVEYGVIVELVKKGTVPNHPSFNKCDPWDVHSAVVRLDLRDGCSTSDWVALSDISPVYMQHARPRD
jgi:hypothetical protein